MRRRDECAQRVLISPSPVAELHENNLSDCSAESNDAFESIFDQPAAPRAQAPSSDSVCQAIMGDSAGSAAKASRRTERRSLLTDTDLLIT